MKDIYGTLLEKIVLPIGDFIFKQDIMRRLEFLREAQWWDWERIDNVRNELLKNLIETAYYEVPFYKEIFEKCRIKPEEIKSPNDLSKLPILTKDIIRDNYPHRITRRTKFKTHENLTSGSTGKNFVVLEDSQTEGYNRAAFILMVEWAGWKIGERHLQTGMTLKRGILKKLKDIILRCEYVSAYDLRDNILDKYLEILEKKKIVHLWGYPGSIYYLAKRATQLGWNIPMKSVVTWGDTLEPNARIIIEKVFKKKINDAYGCSEGIQVACQCGAEDSYHIFSLDTVVEVVDDNGHTLPKGEVGNIVLTRLHPGAMPLIRYRVGDKGVLGEGFCKCGRSFELLTAIMGREVDEIITPTGNKLIVHFFTGIMEHFREISEFQVIQKDKDKLIIKVVPFGSIEESTKKKIIETLKEKGANDMQIDIKEVSEIPLTPAGKRRFVIKDFKE
jgi:phenylacetate-CoA ligase